MLLSEYNISFVKLYKRSLYTVCLVSFHLFICFCKQAVARTNYSHGFFILHKNKIWSPKMLNDYKSIFTCLIIAFINPLESIPLISIHSIPGVHRCACYLLMHAYLYRWIKETCWEIYFAMWPKYTVLFTSLFKRTKLLNLE